MAGLAACISQQCGTLGISTNSSLACIEAMAPSGVTLGTCAQRSVKCYCYMPALASLVYSLVPSTSHTRTCACARWVPEYHSEPIDHPLGASLQLVMTNASVRDGLITDYRQQTPNVIIRLDATGIPRPFFFWTSHHFESSALCTSCCYIRPQTAIQDRRRQISPITTAFVQQTHPPLA